MATRRATVLVVGATGSIGRLVVSEAIREGYSTRALVRDPDKAQQLPPEAEVAVGDVTRPATLPAAVAGAQRRRVHPRLARDRESGSGER